MRHLIADERLAQRRGDAKPATCKSIAMSEYVAGMQCFVRREALPEGFPTA